MTTQIQHTTMLTTLECPCCNMLFAITNRFMADRRVDGAAFYCPQGHKQSYYETEVDRLKKQVARMTAESDQMQARLKTVRAERDSNARKVIAQKAAKTRIKNRIKNGVCPCCNRYFENVHKHMLNQHPEEFVSNPADKGE